ncbi:nitroreductase family protein [Proteinivorax hydrogeniformans]|uniref:Nitroreductase family protein n=1 Tax=Proteinivorax hydrogeniformans TaxID=1826727 RepID=A0AAU8HVR1_9FIRM
MLEILKNRRSIRKYENKRIEQEKLAKLLKAVLLSPTSKNKRPWEFIVVEDTQTMQELSKAKKGGSQFLKNAPLAIVITADSGISDVWVEDASIASITLQYAAESLGLGSCWVQIRNRENDEGASEQYVQDLLGIPKEKHVESIIAIGYPAEEKEPHSDDELLYDKIYRGKYGQAYQ